MIRIFAMQAAGQDFTEARWEPYLSARRRAEADGRKNERERQLFLGAEALLNRSLECLGAQLPLPAAYERNAHGKPYLPAETGLWVNWSHSGEYVICAVADREVGVDLQYTGREPRPALLRRFLQPEERREYEAAAPEEQRELFYRYWTVKESYLKARGTGFSASLKDFYVSFTGDEAVLVTRGERVPYGCRLLRFPEKDYAAAICCEGGVSAAEVTMLGTGGEEDAGESGQIERMGRRER